jgi:hypothetical protein
VSNDGTVFLHIEGPGVSRLLELMKQHLSPTVFTADKRQRPAEIKCDELYAVFSQDLGYFCRVVVKEFTSSTKRQVLFVDYGHCDEVSVGAIYQPPDSDLASLPYQAVRCLLNGVPCDEDTRWTPEGVNLLLQWEEEMDLKVKVLNKSPLTVDLLSAADDESLLPRLLENDRIWQRLSPDTVKLECASIANGADVCVTWADDPYNFRIIPAKFSNELQKLMSAMDTFYTGKNAPKSLEISSLAVGELYAAFYEGVWYRATVTRILPQAVMASCVSVKFVDFGDHSIVKDADLRPLPSHFRQLPLLAISARLDAIAPCCTPHWSEQEKQEFVKMVIDKTFTVYVTSAPPPPSASDGIISLSDKFYTVTLIENLLDLGHKQFIHSVLISKGLAVRTLVSSKLS